MFTSRPTTLLASIKVFMFFYGVYVITQYIHIISIVIVRPSAEIIYFVYDIQSMVPTSMRDLPEALVFLRPYKCH
jgi:hypothetical protein